VELERPEPNGASMHRWSSSHHEESTVSIEVVTI
jgi:hypothetical protein